MRWFRGLFLPLSLAIIAAAVLIVPLPLYLERPGRIVPLAACVTVDDREATQLAGDFWLLTINVVGASAADALIGAFDPDTAVVGRGAILPPGESHEAFFRQQQRVFTQTRDVAAAVGLRGAGRAAEITGDGVAVVQTVPDTPAAGHLEPGDIITAIDGRPVPDETTMREMVQAGGPGTALTFSVTRRNEPVEVELAPVEHEGSTIVGIVPETVNPRVSLPVAVDVASGAVGGPSAGLMIALTVYDKVEPAVDLVAGRTVAGTGTIDQTGRVGPVGGAGLKVIAASRAGADLFLVPRQNAEQARAALPAGSAMEVAAVGTFDEARSLLERTAGDAGTPADPEPCPYQQAGQDDAAPPAGTLLARRGQHRAGGLRGPVRRRPVNLVRAGRQQP